MPDPIAVATGCPDLDDPAVRFRWFRGHAAAALAASCPIVPPLAPGLPALPPSLLELAAGSGDPPPEVTARHTVRKDWAPGPNFHAAVRFALYRDGMAVPIHDRQGNPAVVQYLPGIVDGADGYGPAPVPLVVVGKCLGRDEAHARRPFVGPGSDPLWRAWGEAFMPPRGTRAAYLTNVFRFHPPVWAETAMPRDCKLDGKYLLTQELLLCRPDWLWVLGADAAKAVIGNGAKVKDFLGSVGKVTLDLRRDAAADPAPHTVNLVVTEHPAYVSREMQRYPTFLMGARMLAARSGLGRAAGTVFAPPPPPATDFRPVYTVADLVAAVDQAVAASAGGGYVSVDCEWEGRHPSDPGAYLYTVQFSTSPTWARAVFARRCGGGENPDLPPAVLAAELRRLLRGAAARGARVVGHNLKADLVWLEAAGCDLYPEILAPADDPAPDGSGRPGHRFGFEKTYDEGPFDTWAAGHAVEEQQDLKLEVFAATRLGDERWDGPVREFLDEYCRRAKIKKGQLKGYGVVPEDVIGPYGMADCARAGALYLYLNGDPRTGSRGALDSDRFGKNCRPGYWTKMCGMPAWAEMERYGLLLDRAAHKARRDALRARRDALVEEIRRDVAWPGFTLSKPRHVGEILYGPEPYKAQPLEVPPGVRSMHLTPYKATKAHGERLWADAFAFAAAKGLPEPTPSCDAESLLAAVHPDRPVVTKLMDAKALTTALSNFFRPPDEVKAAPAPGDADDDAEGEGEDGAEPEEVYSRGLLSNVCGDGRVRTMLGLAESGRLRSGRPNLQNCLGPAAEYLTDRGWVPVPDLTAADRVAQFDPETHEIEFVRPQKIHVVDHDGPMVKLRTEEQIELDLTPDHRCLTRGRRSKAWWVTPPADVAEDRLYYHAGKYYGGTVSVPAAKITLLAAVAADGSWTKSDAIKFGFNKRRKYQRLTAALTELGVPWTEPKSDNGYNVYLGVTAAKDVLDWVRSLLGREKVWGPWLLDWDQESLQTLADELFLWDGLATRKTEAFSSNRTAADWVQAVYTLTGVRARMRPYHNGNPNSRVCHIVGVPSRRVPYSMTTNLTKEEYHYAGKVYCVTVPTGFIVVRQNGKVSVTGNCGSAADEKYDRILGLPEGTFKTRAVFVARPGHKIVSTDLKGAEIMAAAILSGDELLLEHALRSTLDPKHPDYLDLHCDLAIRAFNLKCGPNKKEFAKHGYGKYRQAAKPARFGLYYGATADTIWRTALETAPDLLLDDVVRLVKTHDETYPKLKGFFESARDRVDRPGYLVTPWGGRRRFPRAADRERREKMKREAQNFTCQAFVADAMNVASANVLAVRRAWGLSFRVLMAVHDSLVLEVPNRELVAVVDHLLPEAITNRVPLVPCDLEGRPTGGRVYRFAIDTEVSDAWGVGLKEDEWRAAALAV